uniref:Amidase domain-containing protein n=1 Tax=Panagrellus redivivus TaxID=6233 RepID=A0A7E4UQA8_PANRE
MIRSPSRAAPGHEAPWAADDAEGDHVVTVSSFRLLFLIQSLIVTVSGNSMNERAVGPSLVGGVHGPVAPIGSPRVNHSLRALYRVTCNDSQAESRKLSSSDRASDTEGPLDCAFWAWPYRKASSGTSGASSTAMMLSLVSACLMHVPGLSSSRTSLCGVPPQAGRRSVAPDLVQQGSTLEAGTLKDPRIDTGFFFVAVFFS